MSSAYDAVVLADNPTAFWTLGDASGSGTAADLTGNGHTGTVGASVTLGAASLLAADSETAATFPGVSTTAGDITIATSAAFSTTGPTTVEAWGNLAGLPANKARIFNVGGTSAGYGVGVTSTGAMIATAYGHADVTSSQILAKSTGYYVGYVIDPAHSHVLFYVNGALVDTKSLAALTAASTLIAIGNSESSEAGWNGVLQKVAVYSGVALSASRFAAHYAAGIYAGLLLRGVNV